MIGGLQESLGEGKAETVFQDAVDTTSVRNKQKYNKDEALKIAEAIAELDGVSTLVSVAGNTIQTRIRSGNL